MDTQKTGDGAAVLRADGLVKDRGSVRVLDGLSLEVAQGEMLCLLGKNGAGKTTTLHLFLGFMRPTAGTVRVGTSDPARSPAQARAQLAYVPETVALYEHLSAVENLDYLLVAGGQATLSRSALLQILARAGLPEPAARRPARTYSKGMRQKVVIALALAKKARALLLDEPTTGLDPQAVGELSSVVEELRAQGIAVLAATHDLAWAHATADRIGIIREGKVADLIATAQASPQSIASRYFDSLSTR
jgi:ABC-2 type transport system ATP-binding protein